MEVGDGGGGRAREDSITTMNAEIASEMVIWIHKWQAKGSPREGRTRALCIGLIACRDGSQPSWRLHVHGLGRLQMQELAHGRVVRNARDHEHVVQELLQLVLPPAEELRVQVAAAERLGRLATAAVT